MASHTDQREPLLGRNNEETLHCPEGEDRVSVPIYEEIGPNRVRFAIITPLVGLLIGAADVTMVSTVSATIAAEFSSLAVVSWLGTAYLVGVAAIQPISGKLTDHFGRRTGFFWALLLFGIGNLACGLAPNQATLIAGRVVAGVGGGLLASISLFVISDLLPLRKRSVWSGLTSAFWAVGSGTGGVFGGIMNDAVGWRWSFLSLIPCIAVLAFAGYFAMIPGLPRKSMHDTDQKSSKGVDVVGMVALITSLTCLVLGLNLQEHGQNHLLSIALRAGAGTSFAFFVVAEIWFVSDPVIPVKLLTNRGVLGSCLGGLFVSTSMHSLQFYVPLLIQIQGFSTSEVGLQLLGAPVGAIFIPVCIGIAMRRIGGYALTKPLAYLIYLVAPLGFYFSTLKTPAWTIFTLMMFASGGFGSVYTINLIALLANIDDSAQATATGMLYAFRQSAACASLALSGIIFRTQVEAHFTRAWTKLDPLGYHGIPQDIVKQCERKNYIGDEPPTACEIYFRAVHVVFIFALLTAVGGFVSGMIIRNRPLDRDERKLDVPELEDEES